MESAPPQGGEKEGGGDLSKKKVPELKALLRERGLKVSGKKADLIARLRGEDPSPAGEKKPRKTGKRKQRVPDDDDEDEDEGDDDEGGGGGGGGGGAMPKRPKAGGRGGGAQEKQHHSQASFNLNHGTQLSRPPGQQHHQQTPQMLSPYGYLPQQQQFQHLQQQRPGGQPQFQQTLSQQLPPGQPQPQSSSQPSLQQPGLSLPGSSSSLQGGSQASLTSNNFGGFPMMDPALLQGLSGLNMPLGFGNGLNLGGLGDLPPFPLNFPGSGASGDLNGLSPFLLDGKMSLPGGMSLPPTNGTSSGSADVPGQGQGGAEGKCDLCKQMAGPDTENGELESVICDAPFGCSRLIGRFCEACREGDNEELGHVYAKYCETKHNGLCDNCYKVCDCPEPIPVPMPGGGPSIGEGDGPFSDPELAQFVATSGMEASIGENIELSGGGMGVEIHDDDGDDDDGDDEDGGELGGGGDGSGGGGGVVVGGHPPPFPPGDDFSLDGDDDGDDGGDAGGGDGDGDDGDDGDEFD